MSVRTACIGIALAALTCGMPALGAEAVVLSSGEVLFGSIEKGDAGETFVKVYGSGETRRTSTVLRTEADPRALAGTKLEITLKDGSTLHGTLTDFDKDLGIFIDINFGTLHLPFPVIRQVVLDRPTLSDEKFPTSLSVGFSAFEPFDSSLFGLSAAPRLALESRIPGSRAFFLGETLDYFIMTYLPSDEVRYGIMNLSLMLRIRVIPLFTGEESTSAFSPYLALGGGVAFVAVVDNRADAQNKNYGTLDAQARAEAGLEVRISPRLSLGAGGNVYLVLQESHPLWLWGGGIALRYGL